MAKRIILSLFLLISAVFLGGFVGGDTHAQSPSVILSPWQETAEFPGRGHPFPSFARDGYFYVHTDNDRNVYYGRPGSDGNITSWDLAWDDHGGKHGFVAINVDGTPFHFRNGHIARYPFRQDGTVDGDVDLLETDMSASFGGHLWVWDTAVYAPLSSGKYVYHLGGFDCPGCHGTGERYNYNGDIYMSGVPIGDHFTDTGKDHPDYDSNPGAASGPGKSVFYLPNGNSDYGFIYTTRNKGDKVWRIRVNSDGSLGDWSHISNFPQGTGNERGDIFVIGNTLFAVRGKKVFAAALNPLNGDILGWSDDPPDLPSDQITTDGWGDELESSSWGVIGDYVYVTGQSKVYYSRIQSTSQPSPTPTGVPDCQTEQAAGDYNCDEVVNNSDFIDWKSDFEAGLTSLNFFEYWRRAYLE